MRVLSAPSGGVIDMFVQMFMLMLDGMVNRALEMRMNDGNRVRLSEPMFHRKHSPFAFAAS